MSSNFSCWSDAICGVAVAWQACGAWAHTMPKTISWMSPGFMVKGPVTTPKRRSSGALARPRPFELYSLQKAGGSSGKAKSVKSSLPGL